jgi:transposase InsO family protein
LARAYILGAENIDAVDRRIASYEARRMAAMGARSSAPMKWAYQRGVTLDFSRPGKPTDNAFIEAFNGRFRAECLNAHCS